jgi:transposase-like protein
MAGEVTAMTVCIECPQDQLFEVKLTLTDRQVTMHRCMRCERQWWDEEGDDGLRLDHVLALATAAVGR